MCARCGSRASARCGRSASPPARCARSWAGRASASRTCSPRCGCCCTAARPIPAPATFPSTTGPRCGSARRSSAGARSRSRRARPIRRCGEARRCARLFLPASERSGRLVADPPAEPFPVVVDSSSAAPAAALVGAVEQLVERGERGLVLLIEEPELFLPPHTQRYLHRVLRTFAEAGNQVLYSTHSARSSTSAGWTRSRWSTGRRRAARRSCTRSRCTAPPASAR